MTSQKLMQFFLAFRVPMPVIRLVIRAPENRLYTLIFRLTYAYFRLKLNRRDLLPLVRLGLRMDSYIRWRPMRNKRIRRGIAALPSKGSSA